MDIDQIIEEITRNVTKQIHEESSFSNPDGLCANDITKMIDHSLLSPTLTDKELEEECEIANKYGAASVCVKPYHTKKASELLAGTDVLICAVIGFPHGNSSLAVKQS